MEILKNIIMVIVSPRIGWDDVNRSCIPTGRLLSSTFLPLLVVLAVTSFVPMIYDPSLTLLHSLMAAILKFFGYFVTFHLTAYVLASLFPHIAKSQGAVDRLNDFIIYNLIYLILLEIVKNLIPVDFAPIFFMMFYMPYIAHKGTEFLGVERELQMRFAIIASVLMLATPLAFLWLLNALNN